PACRCRQVPALLGCTLCASFFFVFWWVFVFRFFFFFDLLL
ncbi:putative membrane protein, partial [Chlamydia psittaci 10_743_SC13]